ncbi:MAG TPA: putative toxin-antitoxin system toxin component, PIN family [Anaerolineae bacterium]|nr:putative toxin-antitoxin system toxin component, PIN family [Anaerolineae bacterium]HOR00543.1 putative toxin-antitoxin system toxin component, PIN family [Anaerolineae bacterium]HPL28710.1 putative toxin-antitoxin system toxin component, PIN family [Anaerolineae bacterium]
MRIVIDTNVWVSGLLWKGLAWSLLRLAEAGRLQLCAAPEMLTELVEVLGCERLQPRLAQLGLTPAEMLAYAMAQTVLFDVSESRGEPLVVADPDDDVFLHCAVTARAAYVVSGDAHRLALGEHAGIPILSIRDFLAREFPEQLPE